MKFLNLKFVKSRIIERQSNYTESNKPKAKKPNDVANNGVFWVGVDRVLTARHKVAPAARWGVVGLIEFKNTLSTWY